MNSCCLFFLSPARLGLAISLLLFFTGCHFQWGMPVQGFGYPGGLSAYAPRMGSATNHTYYPRYEAYYHHATQQFHFLNGKDWQVQPTLPGSTAKEVLASPGVPFHFTQPPAYYHAVVKQAFPPTWTPGKGRYDEPHEWGHSGADLDRR